jgi:hypothetical protein
MQPVQSLGVVVRLGLVTVAPNWIISLYVQTFFTMTLFAKDIENKTVLNILHYSSMHTACLAVSVCLTSYEAS